MGSYATVDQLRERIQLISTPTAAQLTMLGEILEASSRAIDRACRVVDDGFAATVGASDKYLTAFGKAFLRIPQCTSITTVAAKASVTATTYTAWTTPSAAMAGDGDWIPCRGDPDNPDFGVTPYDLLILDVNGSYSVFLDGDGAPVVKITAVWSTEAAVPADIREACLMQAAKWFKRFQGAGATELGTEELGMIRYRRSLDTAVSQVLADGGRIVPLYGGAR